MDNSKLPCEDKSLELSSSNGSIIELSESDKQKISEKRRNAQLIRQSRLNVLPYSKQKKETNQERVIRIEGTKFIDTGGGFLLEQNDIQNQEKIQIVDIPPPIIEAEKYTCQECQKEFLESYLLSTFNYPVCNMCRDDEEKHTLITKTDAKANYLLKDCDLEKREPPLKYIVRKNPHNIKWGEMKLYLQVQVEKRALEIWGSEEKLEEEFEKREEMRTKAKVKKYNKHMKALRMSVRSSLYDRTTSSSHTHDFSPDVYNEEDDNYSHQCKTCGYEEVFEKM